MPFLLRVIIKNRWYAEYDWIPTGEVLADALKDLGTQAGELSVWEVDDQQSNLERILCALATTRSSFQNIDYLLVDHQVVTKLGISIESKPGVTADPVANRTWHRDLIRLTAGQLAELARACRRDGQQGRYLHKQVQSLILTGVEARRLQIDLMNQELAAKVLAALQANG